MRIAILDQVVRHNVELFRTLVKKRMEKKAKQLQALTKSCHAFIHRQTGEMRFEELEEGALSGKEWKKIDLYLKDGEFEVGDGQERFDVVDLNLAAFRALAETVKTLNVLAHPQAHNPKRLFQEISELELEETQSKKELIHDAWHQVDRVGAEKLLARRPVGTYLFRQDDFAADLEEQLHAKCITLTYSEWDGKISEKILVCKDGQWRFFNDNLDCLGSAYPSVESLLQTMGSLLREPLYHH
jgi:hypothetical protein